MSQIGIFEFTAPLWLHPGADPWHFVTVPDDVSDDLRDLTAGARRGFGSVRVAVRVGGSSWRTSVFPSGAQSPQHGAYVLPVKREVRRAEGLAAGDDVTVRLELLDL